MWVVELETTETGDEDVYDPQTRCATPERLGRKEHEVGSRQQRPPYPAGSHRGGQANREKPRWRGTGHPQQEGEDQGLGYRSARK